MYKNTCTCTHVIKFSLGTFVLLSMCNVLVPGTSVQVVPGKCTETLGLSMELNDGIPVILGSQQLALFDPKSGYLVKKNILIYLWYHVPCRNQTAIVIMVV